MVGRPGGVPRRDRRLGGTHLSSSRSDRRAEYAVAASWDFPSFTSRRSEMESSFRQHGETDGTMCVEASARSRFDACFIASFFRRRFSTTRLLIISASSSSFSTRVWTWFCCRLVSFSSVGFSCWNVHIRIGIRRTGYQEISDTPVSKKKKVNNIPVESFVRSLAPLRTCWRMSPTSCLALDHRSVASEYLLSLT